MHEQALSEALGISRTPVREAIRALAAEGLVEVLSNKGAVVREMTVDEVLDTFQVISDNYVTFWDNRLAGILGYRPEDTSEVYRDKIERARPAPAKSDVVSRLQGGAYCL